VLEGGKLCQYGKILIRMKTTQTSTLPIPPSLIAAMLGGFDTVAKRVSLLLFPIGLDLIIWLGPKIRLEQLIVRLSNDLFAISMAAASEPGEILESAREVWTLIGERLNLMAALRTFPVGIPSLMAARLPVEMPVIVPSLQWELHSWGSTIAVWLILSFLGLFAGSLFCMVVARTAAPMPGRSALANWPWVTTQVFLLTLLWLALIVVVSFPALLFVSVLLLINPGLSGFAGMFVMAGIVWLLFPLFLSPHGIFVNRYNAFVSIKKSLRLTRLTLPATGLFFLMVFLISQGMDTLWSVPPENSWMTIIGLFGHAFLSTGLLAASFIYYREADLFTQKMAEYWSQVR
jgi:hypothetical protein